MPESNLDIVNMSNQEDDNLIRARCHSSCFLCGEKGNYLYRGLHDRLFNAPGEWHFKKCGNSRCGLVWLDPMPIEEDIGKAYKTYFTHKDARPLASSLPRRIYNLVKRCYLANRYGYYPATSRIAGLFGRVLYLYPPGRADADMSVFCLSARWGGRLLEIGCGSGDALAGMQEKGWDAEGIDFDPNAVKNARDKGLNVRLGQLKEQDFPDCAYDAVVMNHVIEHLPDPVDLLHECRRILKTDGVLVVTTPNISSMGHRHFGSFWLHLDPPRHLLLFTPSALRCAAERAAFSRITISSTIRGANGPFIASRFIKLTGSFSMEDKWPVGANIWSRCMQFFEWGFSKVNPLIGEELILKAKK